MSPRAAEFIPAAAAPVFAALGDATRLNLLARLRDGRPRSIVELTDGLGLTRQGVSKHLRVLEDAGMVKSKRIGRESRFVFEPDGLAQARAHLERASRQWDRALERLRALVEEGLRRADDPALLTNIEGQAKAVRHLRTVARQGLRAQEKREHPWDEVRRKPSGGVRQRRRK